MQRLGFVSVVLALSIILFESARGSTLTMASQQEINAAFGEGCAGKDQRSDFCKDQDPEHNCISGNYLLTYSGAVKAWCESVGTDDKVCDCNQTGVEQTDCKLQASCSSPGCTDCGEAQATATVQSSVNLNGKTCNSDEDCEKS